MLLAFEAAYWTRFESSVFLHYFPVTKGIPDIALFQRALWAVLPAWVLVLIMTDFYRSALSSTYDELVMVLKGIGLAALVTMAMTFAFGENAYSRLVVLLWAGYSVVFVFSLR